MNYLKERPLRIVQWGLVRSVVVLKHQDTKELEFLIIDNDYLMKLDEMELVL